MQSFLYFLKYIIKILRLYIFFQLITSYFYYFIEKLLIIVEKLLNLVRTYNRKKI